MQTPRNPNLALVGMHGPPEITGQALQKNCEGSPVEGWDIEVANQQAVDAGRRYVRHNMSMQFRKRPPAERTAANYELWRPSEVCDLVRQYERCLEIHDAPHAATGEFVAVGRTYKFELLRMAAQLGIWSVVNHPHTPTLNNEVSNCLTVELCRDDAGNPQRRLAENVERLRECMRAVASDTLPEVNPADFNYYDYEREIHWREAASLGLDRMGKLDPFEPLPSEIVERLELPPDAKYVAEYWNGVNSASGEWFGGVLRQAQPPDITAFASWERL